MFTAPLTMVQPEAGKRSASAAPMRKAPSLITRELTRTLPSLSSTAHAGVTIAEVGYLLQFSDATAFHRAFKRWTGETPTQYRQRLFKGRH
jgi:AraC-like DNA-binding protein